MKEYLWTKTKRLSKKQIIKHLKNLEITAYEVDWNEETKTFTTKMIPLNEIKL